MTNPYYNNTSNPGNRSTLSSSLIRTEFAAIAAGFNLLPVLSGNANKLVVVDPTGTFLSVIFTGAQGLGDNSSCVAYGGNSLATSRSYALSNSAFGRDTLALLKSADFCTAIGYKTLASVGDDVSAGSFVVGHSYTIATVGSTDFTLIGAASNTVGLTFTATGAGVGSGTASQNGNWNTGIGAQALNKLTYGLYNAAVGGNALFNLLTADRNTAVGNSAGLTLTTGSNNTLIGASADTIAAADNSTALGYQATCTASNQVVIGNASVTMIRGTGDNVTDLGDATHRLKDLYVAGEIINDYLINASNITVSADVQVLSGTVSALAINAATTSAVASSVAIPAGGTAGIGLLISSTANFGIFFGSGVPTLVAEKGSLYLRSDGSSASTRMYVATDSVGGWTNLVTAA